MLTKTTTTAIIALFAASTAFAGGPKDRLVKQLPASSLATAYAYAMDMHRLEGDLATKRAQQRWAADWKHVSETEIYGLESETDVRVSEGSDADGADIRFETEYDTEHIGDVEVDARLADEYREVLDAQEEAIQARLDLAEARYHLYLAEQIAMHVKPGYDVEDYMEEKADCAEEYAQDWASVEEAEAAYRAAGGTLSVRPLIAMDYQYEIDSGVDDWQVERNMTLQ